jgi:hypothetical protein
MIACLKYIAPRVESVRLQLEGVLADSYFPAIKSGKVYYYDYDNTMPEIPASNQNIMILM